MRQFRPSSFQRLNPPTIETTSLVARAPGACVAANTERTPPAHMTTTGRDLSVMRPSTCALEMAAGKEHRPGHRTLLELVGLTDVEQCRPVVEQVLGLGGGHLRGSVTWLR